MMKPFKHFLPLIGIIVSTLLFCQCSFSKKSTKASSSQLTALGDSAAIHAIPLTFYEVNTATPFYIGYPKDFDVIEEIEEGVAVLFKRKQNDAAFSTNYNVVVIDQNDKLDKIVQLSIKGIKNFHPDLKLVQNEDVVLSQRSLRKLVATYKIGDELIHLHQYYIEGKDRKLFILSFSINHNEYEEFVQTYLHPIVSSLHC